MFFINFDGHTYSSIFLLVASSSPIPFTFSSFIAFIRLHIYLFHSSAWRHFGLKMKAELAIVHAVATDLMKVATHRLFLF